MDRILVDTSALYALVDQDDLHHKEAVKILEFTATGTAEGVELVVPNFLVAETHTIINRRIGPKEALRFLNSVFLDYSIERVLPEDEARALIVLQGVSLSKNFSYFDAVAAALAERLAIKQVFTFDKHFEQLGLAILRAR